EGLRAYYQQELHSARRLFRAALAEDSSFALASYYVLTTEWALALAPDTALEAHLRRLAGRLPDRERLVAQGRIAWSSSDPALLPLAETLTARFPDEPEGQLLLGRALAESGHIPRALPRLREVVRTDSLGLRSESPHCHACEAMVAMIEGYIALDSLDAAADLAREWVALQPGSGQPWLHLALVLERQGETDGALAAIGRAAPLVPGNRYLPIYPAILSLRAGEFEAADRLLREQASAGAPDVR
ncbi:MAG: hypothetical protein GWN71_17005, partial [Gammaproteobacteria bacterium]|nr:hypothetical protein [Gemmatimonadota bacterium]NIU75213.1 hypothetical protein [Gammaproteobacteria bacterium]